MNTLEPVAWDPLHSQSDPHLHWTTSNVGEAVPGVMTPLSCSIWTPGGELGLRRACHQLGIVRREEADLPPENMRWVRAFHGRLAMQVEFMALIGDRLPGTTGEEVVASVFGRVPADMRFAPTRSRYASIAYRWPLIFARFPARLRHITADQDRWWRSSIDRLPSLDLHASIALLVEADERFNDAETLQTVSVLGIVQPVFDTLSRLVDRAGTGDVGALSGSGGAELQVVGDIWRASRGEITAEQVIRRHGFHGPREGELSSVVWREEPAPVLAMVEQYAARPDGENPIELEKRREPERIAAEREVLQALPSWQRPAVRALLAVARHRIPMRGMAKRSFLQALDVARGAARRAGELLAVAGVLDEPEDVFFLTLDELRDGVGHDARDLVSRRRARWDAYRDLLPPEDWTGNPIAREATPAERADRATSVELSGIGVSPGVVTGIARVVTDPSFADVEPDEILVAPTTDPSWASIMFISAALVVDIGGALSHAAVVARELGLPCVVNTRTGTATIKTGDQVRVDGTTGKVEILAASPL